MENQHRKIKGYRELSQFQIDKINEVKNMGIQLEKLIADIKTIDDVDPRWVNIGATDLQKGLMGLTRAITNPEGF